MHSGTEKIPRSNVEIGNPVPFVCPQRGSEADGFPAVAAEVGELVFVAEKKR